MRKNKKSMNHFRKFINSLFPYLIKITESRSKSGVYEGLRIPGSASA